MRKSGSSTKMEGNELSHSEYLKCNNACVKVTINRYRRLCSGPLRKVRHGRSLLWLLEVGEETFRVPTESGVPRNSLAERLFKRSPLLGLFISMLMLLESVIFIHTLYQNELAKAEKCKATDLSSLKTVFGCIVIGMEIDQSSSLACIVALLMLMFSLVIKTGKRPATIALRQPDSQTPTLFQRTLQYFEPEEIYHGSGFVIADNFVITNRHVIEEAMSDETLEVRILNETIGDMSCVVVRCDAGSDLALLYCHGLNSKQRGICPLDLSEEALWPSLSVFSFGYPFTHTGRSALFVECKVSGFKERYGREPFVELNGALNHGNSGGPVYRRIGGDIKVVGVAAQKHKKDILTIEEINILEEERSTLNSASDSRDHFSESLLLKIYDSLETHCQFCYGSMVPGHLVVKFLSDPSVKSIMDFLKEV